MIIKDTIHIQIENPQNMEKFKESEYEQSPKPQDPGNRPDTPVISLYTAPATKTHTAPRRSGGELASHCAGPQPTLLCQLEAEELSPSADTVSDIILCNNG